MPAAAELSFIDSNIFIYALAGNPATSIKTARASELILNSQVVVSTQVINEVCINLQKKAAYDETKLTDLINAFYENYTVVEIAKPLLLEASQLRQRFGFSFWDGLIVAAAASIGASKLFSEDMHHGLNVTPTLAIENPFVT